MGGGWGGEGAPREDGDRRGLKAEREREKCLKRCLTPCQEKEGNKSEKGFRGEREEREKKRGWELVKGGEMSEGGG